MIDSHHHLWRYDPVAYPWINDSMSVLKRNFSTNELREGSEEATNLDRTASSLGSLPGNGSLRGTVVVQAQSKVSEAEWLLQCSQADALIQGVVGWVPLLAAEGELLPVLEKLSAFPRFKGVRHVVQDEPDDKFLLRNDFSRGVNYLRRFNLVYDLLIYARHLPAAAAFVDRHPEQIFVLDHIAKPTIDAHRFDSQWAENIRELAKRENVACKFSGLVTEVKSPTWNVELLRPYWETVLDAFGSKRLMFGSDWPVCLLRARYVQWLTAVQALTKDLTAPESLGFWQTNAVKYYHLGLD